MILTKKPVLAVGSNIAALILLLGANYMQFTYDDPFDNLFSAAKPWLIVAFFATWCWTLFATGKKWHQMHRTSQIASVAWIAIGAAYIVWFAINLTIFFSHVGGVS